MRPYPFPAGRLVGADGQLRSIAVGLTNPHYTLPERYFVDHIRFRIDSIAGGASQFADLRFTEDSAGNFSLATANTGVAWTVGIGATTSAGLIVPGQLVWSARQVYIWCQLNAGTCNVTAQVIWRPVPIGE